jgi:DGQHR domain-containing protein
MGFNEMNADTNFKIPRYDTKLSKQIDVFARDEQTICVVECKSTEMPHSRRSLDKDIDQFGAIKHELELSIFSHYRDPKKRQKFKIAWIIALKNIDIGENDLERARKANIHVIDDIEYYSELSKHFGKSARYQFLADMLRGIDIPGLVDPLPAIKGSMGGKTFYSFVIEPEKLLKIAYIAHRAKSTKETMETYQRMAKKTRLARIAEYIHNKEGIFPTSIVINIEAHQPLRFEHSSATTGKNAILGTLYLPNKYKTAWIIDGQHRLFAYSDLEEAKTATLPVIAFENLNTDLQAKLFVDINGEQVKVPKSHLGDLWATIHWNSDDPSEQLKALTSKLVKVLNDDPKSPLRDRIIRVGGRKTKTRNITLTALLEEIGKRKILGSVLSKKAKVITPGPLFTDDLDTTLMRAKEVIFGYFNNCIWNNEKLRKQWDAGSGEGGYICTNSGLIALLRVLDAILDHLTTKEFMDIHKLRSSELVEKIWKYQKPVVDFLDSADADLIRQFRSQYGEGGYNVTSLTLIYEINKVYNNFDVPGLQKYIQCENNEYNQEAYKLISEAEKSMMNFITTALQKKYGSDMSEWWHNGVPESVKKPVVERAHQDGEYHHFERYLELIDWKEIISKNFDMFGDIFTIDATKNDSKKKRLDWLVKLNGIRRIVAHPARGCIDSNQLGYVTKIHSEVMGRLNNSPNRLILDRAAQKTSTQNSPI